MRTRSAAVGRILWVYLAMGAVFVGGGALVAWNLRETLEVRDGGVGQKYKNASIPADLSGFPYDTSGKTLVIELTTARKGEPPNAPTHLLWVRGSRVVVAKQNWASADLDHQRWTIGRDDLDGVVQTLSTRAESGSGELTLTLRGRVLEKTLHGSEADFREALAPLLASAKKKDHTPRFVELSTSSAAPDAATVAWPLRSPSLARVIASGTLLSRGTDKNERIRKALRDPVVCMSEKGPIRVRARALAEEPP